MKWSTYSLESIATFVGGGTPSKSNPEFWRGDIPWVSPKDMTSNSVKNAQDHINDVAVRESATQIIPRGSVLIVVRSGILARRMPVAINEVPVAINQDMKALVPFMGVESKYLGYFLQAKESRILAGSVKFGATVHSVDIPSLRKLHMPLPAPSEQRRIVELLDQADALRKQRAEADQLADRILPALFLKMFGDPATNPRGWRCVKMEDLIESTRNGLYKPAEYFGCGVAILKMFNILNGYLNLTRVDQVEVSPEEFDSYRLLPGDILMNRVNTPELVGKCAVIAEEVGPAVFESKNIRIRIRPLVATPEYTASYLSTDFGHRALGQGMKHAIGMATVNNDDLRKMDILLPPLALQQRYSTLLKKARSLNEKSADSKSTLETLFSNLLGRAFTGDLTAKWRDAHMKELLQEMEQQARYLRQSAGERIEA